jgi:cell pole-organizing protein PopZ
MTDQSAQEPTMEEILASIRRIISEDEAPAETPAAAMPEATPEPIPEPIAAETDFAASVEPASEPAAVEDDVLLVHTWEGRPLHDLAQRDELQAFEHHGFWQPMDTLREKNLLEDLWASGRAPWKVWA